MRCPECRKFVSFDTDTEPEVNDVQSDDSGVVTATARIVNNCAECSTELTEATLEIEIDMGDEWDAHVEARDAEDEASGAPKRTHTPEVSDYDGTRTERTQNKDHHGCTITRSRYMRRYYGADITATLRCTTCDEEIATSTAGDDVQASGMDEC